jgi:hypothetical protein
MHLRVVPNIWSKSPHPCAWDMRLSQHSVQSCSNHSVNSSYKEGAFREHGSFYIFICQVFPLVRSCKWGVGNNLGTHKDCLNLCLVSISLVLLKEMAVSQTSGWSEIMDDVKACKIICMIHHQTRQVQPGWSMWFLQASFLRIILQQIQCNVTRTSGCSPRLWPHWPKAKAKTCLGWLEQLDNMYSILVYTVVSAC